MAKKKRVLSVLQKAVQEAGFVTGLIVGSLKRANMLYLDIAALLIRVRDEKMYVTLHHPDLEDYAAKRLNLGRASLYKYIRVYDWVRQFHPEWLEKKVKGRIPDLNDAADLMWIENELKHGKLTQARRATLEELRAKGLAGNLRKGELGKWRKQGDKTEDTIKSCLSALRRLRMRWAQLASMPTEVVEHLDSAIGLLKNETALAQCNLGDPWKWEEGLLA